jgi:hypothetical protein
MNSGTVFQMDADDAVAFIEKQLEVSEAARALFQALQDDGLTPNVQRSQLFGIYSRESRKSLSVGILPFITEDLVAHGAISVSEGGFARAVIVNVEGRTNLTEFVSVDYYEGELLRQTFSKDDLTAEGVEAVAQRLGILNSPHPLVELSGRQVNLVAHLAFTTLHRDEFSRQVYGADDLLAISKQAPSVSDAAMVMMMSTGVSHTGCSCSSSCYGCSSCSCSWS